MDTINKHLKEIIAAFTLVGGVIMFLFSTGKFFGKLDDVLIETRKIRTDIGTLFSEHNKLCQRVARLEGRFGDNHGYDMEGMSTKIGGDGKDGFGREG